MCEPQLLVERLVEAVRKRPALYDPAHPEFRQGLARAEEWSRITLELGYETGDEHIMKSKWRNLRDSYLKYKRTLHPGPGGSGAKVKNYKNWPWAPYMEFLDSYLDGTKSLKYEDDTSRDLAEAASSSPKPYDDADAEEEDLEAEEEDEVDLKPPRDFRRRRKNICRAREAFNRKEIPRLKRNRRLDSVDLLFQSYAQTIKSFGAKRRALLKMQMSTMFAQAEIEEIEERERGFAGGAGGGDPLLVAVGLSDQQAQVVDKME